MYRHTVFFYVKTFSQLTAFMCIHASLLIEGVDGLIHIKYYKFTLHSSFYSTFSPSLFPWIFQFKLTGINVVKVFICKISSMESN